MTNRFNTQSHRIKGGVKFPEDAWGVAEVKVITIPTNQIHKVALASWEELQQLANQTQEG